MLSLEGAPTHNAGIQNVYIWRLIRKVHKGAADGVHKHRAWSFLTWVGEGDEQIEANTRKEPVSAAQEEFGAQAQARSRRGFLAGACPGAVEDGFSVL